MFISYSKRFQFLSDESNWEIENFDEKDPIDSSYPRPFVVNA